MKILGISGSLRKGSLNTQLIQAAATMLPEGVTLELLDYGDVPLYNADLGEPEAVVRLRATVAGADALLIATPEYNHSVPGVLKNTIDWASRPAFKSSLAGKATAVLSASPGAIGGARAQQHLKVILLGAGVPVYAAPEVVLGQADKKLADGVLTDEGTVKFLTGWLAGFVKWARAQ